MIFIIEHFCTRQPPYSEQCCLYRRSKDDKRSRFLHLVLLFSLISMVGCHGSTKRPRNQWDLKAEKEGITDTQRRVYLELANFPDMQLTRADIDYAVFKNAKNPLADVIKIGIDAIPCLVEALADKSFTKVITRPRKWGSTNDTSTAGELEAWRVNDLAAHAIEAIARRGFEIELGGERVYMNDIGHHLYLIPEFQKQVLDWYEKEKPQSEK